MQKQTIFLVTNNYKPYAGGVARAIDAWCRELIKRGHRAFIITLDFTGSRYDEDDEYVIRLPSCARFFYKNNPLVVPYRGLYHLYRLAWLLKPHIIHVHHPFLLGPYGLQVARSLRLPCILTYHMQYEQHLHNIPLPSAIMHYVVTKTVQSFCQQVDGIIAPSHTIAQEFYHEGLRAVTVLPNPIDDIFFAHVPQKEVNREVITLITVSRFSKEKNIPFLLRVMSKLDPKRFRLLLIGYGPDAAILEHYAFHVLKLCPHAVRFIVKPSRILLRDYYRSADLFIFASPRETQGLVLAEAMACATPAIAFTSAGACDIIEHEKNGYLVNSEEEMMRAITFLANHPAQLKMFSMQARKTAQRFHACPLTTQLEELYMAQYD